MIHRKAVVVDLLGHTCHARCEPEGDVLVSLEGAVIKCTVDNVM